MDATEIYIKGKPEAITKIWEYVRDKSGLKFNSSAEGGDYWIIDFMPQIKKEEEQRFNNEMSCKISYIKYICNHIGDYDVFAKVI